jgi:bacterioferritin-associated ferredoxin
MYACVCFSVTEEEIAEEIANGAHSEDAIGDRCGAGTSCGTCVERLGCLLDQAQRNGMIAARLAACPVPCPPALKLHGDAPCPALV